LRNCWCSAHPPRHGFGFPVPALALEGRRVANHVALLYFGCARIALRAANVIGYAHSI
jgi:hypothetical protein